MIIINKKRGELLSELLSRAREENNIKDDIPITYAGRLDPIAEGVMILLVGKDEVKDKEKYLGLEKVYTFQILFGVSTDTHDPLGIIDKTIPKIISEDLICENLKSFPKKFTQNYPAFSSKTVGGVPLFEYAKKGEGVEIPKHEVGLFEIKLLSFKKVLGGECAEEAINLIEKIKGDFRQEECKKSWADFKNEFQEQEFIIAEFQAKVGSGFYVRMFANDLAEKMGTCGLAWFIRRDSVGIFK